MLSASSAPSLATLDDVYRTFRAAVTRGEHVSLSLAYKEGKVVASFDMGNSAVCTAAAQLSRSSLQPAAAGPAPTYSPPASSCSLPPAGGGHGAGGLERCSGTSGAAS
jgi:hypothetical protein